MLEKTTGISRATRPGSPLTTKVLLVAPKFSGESFWSLTDTCKLANAKTTTVPLGFLTLAAMLPADWDLRLVDCQVEPLTDAHLAWADLVMDGRNAAAGGRDGDRHSPRPGRGQTGLRRRRRSDVAARVVCGDQSRIPGAGRGRGNYRHVRSRLGVVASGRAISSRRSSRSTSPRPRYRATTSSRSRTTFGSRSSSRAAARSTASSATSSSCTGASRAPRRPRRCWPSSSTCCRSATSATSTSATDNLIGNKKALKKFLPELIAWQKAHDYPFRFSTEASMNLADDEELLHLLVQANFFLIFVGIESGDTATLISMQKKQNTRRSLAESVQRINAAGILVGGGLHRRLRHRARFGGRRHGPPVRGDE